MKEVIEFYNFAIKRYPKVAGVLIRWTAKNKIPITCNGFPDIQYIIYFFDKVWIMSSVEPRYVGGYVNNARFDYYFKDLGSDDIHIHTNQDQFFESRLECELKLLDAMFSYLEKKL
jgi:hypothetical protein